MAKSANSTTVREYGALERFLGENTQVYDGYALQVNEQVLCDLYNVSLHFNENKEDKACMYTYPIGQAKFCLKLIYLLHTDQDLNKGKVFLIELLPSYFDAFSQDVLMANMPFRFDQSWEQEIPLCSQTRILLHQLQENNHAPVLINALKLSETVMHLFRKALQCATQQQELSCHVPSCRFLDFNSEREKVMEARLIIEQQLDKPFTIKELSRKVAMNECYLKKGFKALFGKTINDYQQELRISKAKELLQQNGQSVSYVASTLGYSSISHFSTAFKKATGIKPCELLN